MRLLIIRFSSIGDIVLTTPVLRCLRQQTSAEIDFLTKKQFANLVVTNTNISRVFSFEKDVSEVITDLKSRRYDAVIDLHHNLRSLRVKLALGTVSYSFDKINWQKWLLVNTKIDRLPNQHIVERYFATTTDLGVKNDHRGLDFFIPCEFSVKLDSIGVHLEKDKFVAFVIGATHATKRLPEDKIEAICREIKSKNKQIVLLGGPEEAEIGQRIAEKTGVFNVCGKLKLHESASIVRDAGCVITHDTGLMHIAAALQKKIVSIWGNTIPKFGMTPFFGNGVGQNVSFEVENLACRPCSKIGFEKCPKGHFRCMRDQSVAEISAAALNFLENELQNK
jgi:ADP-heptose:LPS heptosyltransferase